MELKAKATLTLSIFTLFTISTLLFTLTPESPKRPSHSRYLHLHHESHVQLARATCDGTLYPDLCVSTLSTFPNLASKTLPEIISATVNLTAGEVRSSAANCSDLRRGLSRSLDLRQRRALDDCLELLGATSNELAAAISDLSGERSAARHLHDLQTLLSAAMTNQYTCLDGFAHVTGHAVRDALKENFRNITRHVSNSLAMLKKIPGPDRARRGNERRAGEVFPEYGRVTDRFPTWVSGKDRRLLQLAANVTKYNLIVAKDGSGNFTTVGEAVAAAPNSSATRFVIYIKAGAYFENVEVIKKKTNIMFLGDGIGKTIIKASRNVVDGWTTFQSATVAVVGNGFIAKGITVENSAGPSKHQAVAVRSGSDLSVFYQCSFVGYQDTLYVHSLRQFYRECDVYGTVDFIFGNAAVVFQNCNLYARKPNPKQKNLFTAQGREDPNQNTGISILNCKVAAAADLIPVQSEYPTYLGRPWKLYSRTVFLGSNIGDLVDPAGYLEWNGTFALSTLYYGEYNNRGPGSNTTGRVKWPGFRVINSSAEAGQFTVSEFIQGTEWLNGTGVPYYAGLN